MTGLDIKIERVRKGLTQVQLAEKAKINAPHLSKIERGNCSPTQRTIDKLKKVFDS